MNSGGWRTAAIVAGVALLGVLAAADALRGDEPETPRPGAGPTTREGPPTVAETLRREDVRGWFLYSDETCGLHSLSLPNLEDEVVHQEDGSEYRQCQFSVGAGRILASDEVASPDGQLVARCRGGQVEVLVAAAQRRLSRERGCAPAWRPDGTLTYTRAGAVYAGHETVLSAPDLREIARRHPILAGFDPRARVRVRVLDMTWLDDERLIAAIEIKPQYVEFLYESILYDGEAVIGVTGNFGRLARGWFAGSSGVFAAAENGTIMMRSGDSVDPPQGLPEGRAVAFSPDDQWLAYLTARSVYLIGTPMNIEPGRVIQIPLAAQDLAWEALNPATRAFPSESR
jgi:hypothetical protein